MPTNDTPVTDAELDQFYGRTLTQTAIEIGEEELCSNLFVFGEWLAEDDEEREMSAFFGPISRSALVREVMLRPGASDQQIAEAVRELRRRYLSDMKENVLRHAARSME